MGSIGCALAFGPANEVGVTGIGFSVGDLVDDLHGSLLAHPGYPALLDRQPTALGHADKAMDAFLATHDVVEAIQGRDVDAELSGLLVDIADRARRLAGTPGFETGGRRVRLSERRCVTLVTVSMSTTGSAMVCGTGPRLGLAFASAIASLQEHPLLRAFSEHRPPSLAELEAARDWRDPVLDALVLETED